jgi:DNA repair protein RecO (recombination protein O)
MVVYNKAGEHLNRISESRLAYPFQKIPFDIRRSSTGLFIAEILSKVLREEKEEPALYDFLYQTIIDLDTVEEGLPNFPLVFLVKLAEALGVSVEDTSELASQLNLHGIYFDNELRALIEQLINADYENDLKIHKKIRAKAIDTLIAYFALHFENFGKVQSVEIFREL